GGCPGAGGGPRGGSGGGRRPAMLRPCVTVRDLSGGMSPPGSRPLRAREAFSVPVPRPPPGAWPRRGRGQSGGGEKVRGAGNTIYRGCLGMLILIVLAAIPPFLIVSAVVSAPPLPLLILPL